jgi:predicted kinase
MNISQPHLFLMLGIPGAGKTTTARLLSKALDAEHVWADFERYQHFGKPPYTPQQNLQFYAELNQQVALHLENNRAVIYDAAFNYADDRQELMELAQKRGANTTILWVRTPKSIAQKRASVPGAAGRILGAMSQARFVELSHKLEKPRPSEVMVEIDGTTVDDDTIVQLQQKINDLWA